MDFVLTVVILGVETVKKKVLETTFNVEYNGINMIDVLVKKIGVIVE